MIITKEDKIGDIKYFRNVPGMKPEKYILGTDREGKLKWLHESLFVRKY